MDLLNFFVSAQATLCMYIFLYNISNTIYFLNLFSHLFSHHSYGMVCMLASSLIILIMRIMQIIWILLIMRFHLCVYLSVQ